MAETGFDETPDVTSSLLQDFARSGFVNIAGGCCGTTPEHIQAIAAAVPRARAVEAPVYQPDGSKTPPRPPEAYAFLSRM